MRFAWLTLPVIMCLVAAAVTYTNSAAQEPKTTSDPAPKEEPQKGRIVPVVSLKPGETKELLMSAPCALLTRGGGLLVRDMGESASKERTVWRKNGVTVELPNMGEAAKAASAPIYEPLKSKGLSPFVVKVSASKDAKIGLIDLHIADETCSGTCSTDFRVLVLEQ
jgi:hypothetical protein